MITSLSQMVEKVLEKDRRTRIAVARAQDPNTISAVNRAAKAGLADFILIGDNAEIEKTCSQAGVDPGKFEIITTEGESDAASYAVRLAAENKADIVMKGLIGTDKFLKAVMDKEKGLMKKGAVLSYVGAIEISNYNKLLFITDPAVIPYPNFDQKLAMAQYAIEIALRFGLEKPKMALIGASEKPGSHFSYSSDYLKMIEVTGGGEKMGCIMDGPLDLFLACHKESPGIKGVNTPINGEADILLFPSLEASNPFYKSLMLFAGGELAGLIRGTTKPVIVMSRSESELSKYYCIALACLMADE